MGEGQLRYSLLPDEIEGGQANSGVCIDGVQI